MSNRIDGAALIVFLARQYATHAVGVTSLAHGDKQVYRVKRVEGPDWVVRAYQPTGYQGDAETVAALVNVLLFLEGQLYPAERVIRAVDGSTITRYGEWLVLVTTFEGQSLQPWQPGVTQTLETGSAADDALAATPSTFYAVGAALGRLHRLQLDADQPLRRAGMLPKRELTWVAGLLAEVAGRVPTHLQGHYDELVADVKNLDHCEDLPISLIHNDCNLGNVVMTPAGEIVLIDWECAGLGPAVIDVGILLRNCYAEHQPNVLRERVFAVVDGYCQHRRLSSAELDRLPDAIRFMTLVLLAACFPHRVDQTLRDDDLIYGATYAAWLAHYQATNEIAAFAKARFDAGNSDAR